MLKLIATLAMAIIASVSFAGDYDYIRGGAMGYVSFQDDIAAFVQLRAGEKIIVWNINEDTLKMGCGIGSITGKKVDKAGIDYFGYTALTADLYQIFCYKISGTAGNTYLAILEDTVKRKVRSETPLTDAEMKTLTEKWKK